MSKGSKQRPTDHESYSANYDAIFGKKRREVPTIDPDVEEAWDEQASALADLSAAVETNYE